MAIPLIYNLRNLTARRTTTILTVVCLALTVTTLAADLALVNGLRRAFQSSGNPLNILLLRKGNSAELSSTLSRQVYQDMMFKPGIARSPMSGKPLASLELVTTITLMPLQKGSRMTISLRGMMPVGIELRNLRLVEGRWFQAGQREVVLGKAIANRCGSTHAGEILHFGKQDWKVAGIMDGGESVVNSEIFADLNQVGSNFNRFDLFTSILLKAVDEASIPALIHSLDEDRRLGVSAQTEKTYYGRQTTSAQPLQLAGIFVSFIMGIGSIFANMNTMYAAVSRRCKEIGTLRILGFTQRSILNCFFIESLLLASIAGLFGCLLALPLNFLSTSIGNLTTVSETVINFRVGPAIMVGSLLFALIMGALGGWLPARMAAKKEILGSLREP